MIIPLGKTWLTKHKTVPGISPCCLVTLALPSVLFLALGFRENMFFALNLLGDGEFD
jgi:hypothetical protein